MDSGRTCRGRSLCIVRACTANRGSYHGIDGEARIKGARVTWELAVERKRRILFVCIGNCCRSPLAEALLRHRGSDRFEARSAGTRPVGFVHPVVLQVLVERGVRVDGLCSQGCAEYVGQGFDAVITLCDCADLRQVLDLAGGAAVVHWPTRDPYVLQWKPPEMVALAREVAAELDRRIEALLALDWGVLSPPELKHQLAQIGTS